MYSTVTPGLLLELGDRAVLARVDVARPGGDRELALDRAGLGGHRPPRSLGAADDPRRRPRVRASRAASRSRSSTRRMVRLRLARSAAADSLTRWMCSGAQLRRTSAPPPGSRPRSSSSAFGTRTVIGTSPARRTTICVAVPKVDGGLDRPLDRRPAVAGRVLLASDFKLLGPDDRVTALAGDEAVAGRLDLDPGVEADARAVAAACSTHGGHQVRDADESGDERAWPGARRRLRGPPPARPCRGSSPRSGRTS